LVSRRQRDCVRHRHIGAIEVALLKKDGKTADAHYYANEGHGFAKRENQIDSIRRSVERFDKYLKGSN
jgi:dipeptidyl aminopeptidase/acylaminoacyl peptidase